ncbi:glutathione S-transferase family protein [Tepidicaulis sp. LMO-SS28]|uniref:glutathione S-transferase family protein n=1 Tax=Tepidicaulis sp. LMO-SS28 TaxID=3447455 RepID=UPI003EE0949D
MSATANDILFHQYDISPFSEKVRVAFGIKNLEWYAVEEPVIMPKPELTALTGGYRKIPVMQIGADIYCDSQIILRELERRFPEPTLFPAGDTGLAWAVSMWADRVLFQNVVAVIFGGGPSIADEAFIKDREKLTGRPFDTEAMKQAAPMMAEQARAGLSWLEDQLADGRAYLTGEKPGLADAAAYYNLAFLRWLNPAGLKVLESLPKTAAWDERVRGIGHGKRAELNNKDALAIAKAATSQTKEKADPNEPNGLKPGDTVSVMADDYGRDPITGTLVASDAQSIAIRREDPQVGEVVVHFPRAGFFVMKG